MNTLILLLALIGQDKPFPVADPKPAIEAAQKKAAAENRRVLVLTGTNSSEGCRAVATMLKKDREVAKLILYEYDVVLVGLLEMGGSSETMQHPLLAIKDADGKDLFRSTAPAEAKAMVELLNKHKAPPLIAKDVLDAAKKKAAEEKKRVLLTFGAPW